MNIYIDAEFNEFGGELISFAAVADNGREFYEVAHCANPKSWVAENVMPVLGRNPISLKDVKHGLSNFLSQYETIHIVADWPDDIKFFCELLIVGPGLRLDTPPLTLEIRRDIDSSKSEVPHNALHDARAIRLAALS